MRTTSQARPKLGTEQSQNPGFHAGRFCRGSAGPGPESFFGPLGFPVKDGLEAVMNICRFRVLPK